LPKELRLPNDVEPTWALSGPSSLAPDTTDELTPNRLEDPNVDLLEPGVMLVERVLDAIVVLRLFPPTAGRAPADAEPTIPRLPATVLLVPRLPIVPVLPEFRAVILAPDRPGAAPKRALEGGAAADLPPFMP
jgi:hypothetical protein